MTAFMRDSFSVSSPGTKDSRDSYDRIFNCEHGNKKSTCTEPICVEARKLGVDTSALKEEGK